MPLPNCFGRYSQWKNRTCTICMYKTPCIRKENGQDPLLIQLDEPDAGEKLLKAPGKVEKVTEAIPDYETNPKKKNGTLIKV